MTQPDHGRDRIPVVDAVVSAYERLPSTAERRAGRMIVGALIALVAATIVYFALGMPGMDHGARTDMGGTITHHTLP